MPYYGPLDAAEATSNFHSVSDISNSQSRLKCDAVPLEVVRQHHADLVDVIDSHESFAKLLHQLFSKKVIESATYKKFLTKLDNNPQCLLTVLSGQLLLDISEKLEIETNSQATFDSLCECIKQLCAKSAAKLKSIYI